MECATEFTFFTRHHHCRGCGHVVCYKCSSGRVVIADSGSQDQQRVCDGCAVSLEDIVRPRGEILAGTFQIEARIQGDCARWRSTKRFSDFRELAHTQGLQSCWRTAHDQSSGVVG